MRTTVDDCSTSMGSWIRFVFVPRKFPPLPVVPRRAIASSQLTASDLPYSCNAFGGVGMVGTAGASGLQASQTSTSSPNRRAARSFRRVKYDRNWSPPQVGQTSSARIHFKCARSRCATCFLRLHVVVGRPRSPVGPPSAVVAGAVPCLPPPPTSSGAVTPCNDAMLMRVSVRP